MKLVIWIFTLAVSLVGMPDCVWANYGSVPAIRHAHNTNRTKQKPIVVTQRSSARADIEKYTQVVHHIQLYPTTRPYGGALMLSEGTEYVVDHADGEKTLRFNSPEHHFERQGSATKNSRPVRDYKLYVGLPVGFYNYAKDRSDYFIIGITEKRELRPGVIGELWYMVPANQDNPPVPYVGPKTPKHNQGRREITVTCSDCGKVSGENENHICPNYKP